MISDIWSGEALIFICMTLLLSIIFFKIYQILKNPYRYPYNRIEFNVSGRRLPDIRDEIEEYINKNGIDEFETYQQSIQNWKDEMKASAEKSILRRRRIRQLESVIDDDHAFVFTMARAQTRYRQSNYKKTSYQVMYVVETAKLSLADLQEIYDELKSIGFETTLKKYHSKNQRKLMTPALRRKIIERDNYTCQICGKYMPDEVGLHVDHIVPVAKGGKSVESNLQVLCSKCNGRKSDRV